MEKMLKKIDPALLATLATGATKFFTTSQASTPISPAIKETFDTIISMNNMKYALTVFLFLWAISRIIIEFLPEKFIPEKQKDNAKYINKVFFGDTGVIPMIFTIWVLMFIVTTIIPTLIDISPKFSNLLSGVNRFVSSFSGSPTNV
jgi:hypothetical protein